MYLGRGGGEDCGGDDGQSAEEGSHSALIGQSLAAEHGEEEVKGGDGIMRVGRDNCSPGDD